MDKSASGLWCVLPVLVSLFVGCSSSGGGDSATSTLTSQAPELNARALPKLVTLSWNDTGAKSYDLFYSSDPTCDINTIDACTNGAVVNQVTSPHAVAGLINGQHYTFWLKANHGTYTTVAQSGARPDQLTTDGVASATNNYASVVTSGADGTVYLGGTFTRVGARSGGGVPLSNKSVGTLPFPVVTGNIRAVVSDGTGGWYIGGTFTHVGGLARNNIARINADGSVHSWNPNANGTVYALALSGTKIYAGGYFTQIGGALRDNIAALDVTTNTSNAISNWNTTVQGPVFAVAVSGSTVYIGGAFTAVGNLLRNNIAALDSTSGVVTDWIRDANGGIGAQVNAIVASDNTMYVGGSFTEIGGHLRNNIAALDIATGNVITEWNPGTNSWVWSLALSGNTLYLGGAFTEVGAQPRNRLAALDAAGAVTAWDPGVDGVVATLAVSGTTVYAGGWFDSVGGQMRYNIAAIDANGVATGWNPDATGAVRALAVSNDTIYLGGDFRAIGGEIRNRIAALDADGYLSAWNPNADAYVREIAVSDTTVYVGGGFSEIGGQTRRYLAALDKVTGTATSWNPDPTGPVALAGGAVTAMALRGSALYVGGYFTNISNQPRNHLAGFDANGNLMTWNPNLNDVVQDMAVNGSTLYVGGFFTRVGALTRNYLAAFDTTANSNSPLSWDPNANGFVHALAVDGSTGTVYAGGRFTSFTDTTTNAITSRNHVAALTTGTTGVTTAWNPSANGDVYALALNAGGTTLYAGGSFTSVNCTGTGTAVTRNNLAAFDTSTGDPTSWNRSTTGLVFALSLTDSLLHVGGDFMVMNAQPAGGYGVVTLTGDFRAPCAGVIGGGVLLP